MEENNVKSKKKRNVSSQPSSLNDDKISNLQELREDDFPINEELISAKKNKSKKEKEEVLMKEDNKKVNNLENELPKNEDLESKEDLSKNQLDTKQTKAEPKFQKIEIPIEGMENNDLSSLNVKPTKPANEEGKSTVNNLQKLREQIQAQKKLERKIMESEVAKTQSKDKELLTKLSQLESLAVVEENESEELILLEQENEKLNKKLKDLNSKFKKLVGLKYNDLPVINKKTLDFNTEIIKEASSHDDINTEINRLEHELDELNKSHTNNIQEILLKNKEELDGINNQVNELNEQVKTLQVKLDKEKKLNKELKENSPKDDEKVPNNLEVDKMKTQLEELKKLNKDANKELAVFRKLDVESLKSDRIELLKQTRSLEKEVDKLSEKLASFTSKATEEKGLLVEELKLSKKELKKYESKALKLEEKVNESKEKAKEMKAEINRLNKIALSASELELSLQEKINLNKDLETRNAELENLLSKNDAIVAEFKEQLKITRRELKKATSSKNKLEEKTNELKTTVDANSNVLKELEDKNAQILSLNHEISNLELDIKKLEIEVKRNEDLEKKNNELHLIIDKANENAKLIELELNKVNEEKKNLEELLKNKDTEVNSLILKIDKLNHEIEEIKTSTKSDDEKENLLIKLENQNTDLIAELDLKNDEIDELNEKVQLLEVEIKDKLVSSKELEELSTTYNELTLKYEKLEQEHSKLVNDYDNRLDEVSDLKEKIEEYEFLLQESKESTSEDINNQETAEKLLEINNELESKDNEILDLKANIESLELEIKDLQELKNDNLIINSQVKDLENRLGSKNLDIKNLESKISGLYEKINSKENEYKLLLSKKDEENQELLSKKELELQEALNQKHDLELKVTELSGKAHVDLNEYQTLQSKIEELNKEIAHLKEKHLIELNELEVKNNRKLQEFQDYNRNSIDKVSILERNLANAISDKNDYIIELERTKKLLSEEKFNHHDEISRLRRDLDYKADEVERLKQEIANQSQRRLDTTINNLVNELERKTNFNYQQVNPMMYPNLYNFDKVQKDHEKELEAKEAKIKELENKQLQIEDQMKDKIQILENQLKNMESLIKSEEKEDKETQYQDNLKALKKELEEYKQEIKEDIERQIESRTNIYLGSNDIQNIIKKYTSEKELITYRFNSELNRLEAQKKFVDNTAEAAIINEKISHLKTEYKKLLDENDYRFRNEITKNSTSLYDEVKVEVEEDIDIKSNEPTEDDIPNYLDEFESYNVNLIKNDDQHNLNNENDIDNEQFIDEDYEEDSLEEEIYNVIDFDDDDLYEDELPEVEAPAVISETDAPLEENRKSTIVYGKPREMEDDFRIVGKVGQDYLTRISNNRKLKISLQEKQREEIDKYNLMYQENIKLQEELQSKINGVLGSIDALEDNYNASKYHSPDQTKEYENQKTKLYFELENRQEKLRKHKEEDIRKLELRHKNIMINLSEQIAQLDFEEKSLKEAYLNKQQKELSKQNRDNLLLSKLEEERRNLETEKQEIKDIAPVDQNQDSNTEKSRVIVSKDEKRKSLLAGESNLDNEAKEEVELSSKEKELVLLFKKYQAAEQKMKNELGEVKLYSDNLVELNGFKSIYERQISEIEELRKEMATSSNKEEIASKITDLNIKSNNLKNKIDYRNNQLEGLKSNKAIGEYIKLANKLEDIKKLLIKYSKKRNM